MIRAALLLLAGCAASAAPAPSGVPASPSTSPEAGLAILRGADCAVCHAIPDVEAPARTASCVGCHAWVKAVAQSPKARAVAMSVFPKWERYERTVRSYAEVPDLGAAAARLDPAWWGSYLRDPHDLRPMMDETMVRVGLDATQLAAVTAWAGSRLVPVPPTPAPDRANLARGEALFASKGCVACHTFGARSVGPGIAAAPDLRHARDRMSDDGVVAWIVDPTAVSPQATMPALGVTREEAIALRDWIVLAEPGGSRPPAPAALPVVTRPVAYAEVEEKVFGKICIHCHMDPEQNEGRAGPGNAGGFGWPATGIELQNVASLRKHGPAILDALLRRRDEAVRDVVHPGEAPASTVEFPAIRPEKPGMPLGLPPIPDADIALVRAWYAQGAPGSGEPGSGEPE
ncbi:MAG: c-type cytochrome [Pseudomonadota bacterium]|nr:c-type cytochrome [Pseudomonadota bacterium]